MAFNRVPIGFSEQSALGAGFTPNARTQAPLFNPNLEQTRLTNIGNETLARIAAESKANELKVKFTEGGIGDIFGGIFGGGGAGGGGIGGGIGGGGGGGGGGSSSTPFIRGIGPDGQEFASLSPGGDVRTGVSGPADFSGLRQSGADAFAARPSLPDPSGFGQVPSAVKTQFDNLTRASFDAAGAQHDRGISGASAFDRLTAQRNQSNALIGGAGVIAQDRQRRLRDLTAQKTVAFGLAGAGSQLA